MTCLGVGLKGCRAVSWVVKWSVVPEPEQDPANRVPVLSPPRFRAGQSA